MIDKFALGATALLAVATVSSTAHAATAADYNLFVLGNMTSQGSDVEGKVAVRGDANLQGYSVALNAKGGDALVVGGTFTGGNWGGTVHGNVVAGGKVSTQNWSVEGTSTGGATSLPVDFAAESSRLSWLATELASYATNGKTEQKWGQMFFTGADSKLNVFTVTTDQLASSNTFHFDVTSGSQVLLNVAGSNASMKYAGFDLKGVDNSKILYNFYQASTLSFDGIGVQGSVLAAGAAYKGGYGNVDGQMIVGSYDGPTQINSHMYGGTLLALDKPKPVKPSNPGTPGGIGAVPEPATWAMIIAGFGLVGGAIRRARRQGLAFA